MIALHDYMSLPTWNKFIPGMMYAANTGQFFYIHDVDNQTTNNFYNSRVVSSIEITSHEIKGTTQVVDLYMQGNPIYWGAVLGFRMEWVGHPRRWRVCDTHSTEQLLFSVPLVKEMQMKTPVSFDAVIAYKLRARKMFEDAGDM